jgi:prophage antirepressor-like protein
MTNIVPFSFESQEVRVLVVDDEPWWVALDVCTVLEIKNVGNVIAKLDDDEKRDDIQIVDAIGRSQLTWLINESGLYSLILTSRKPQAKAFKRWLTHEVIPSIRKNGRYEVKSSPQPTELIAPSYVEEMLRRSLSRTSLSIEQQELGVLRGIGNTFPQLQRATDEAAAIIQESTSTLDRHITPTALGKLYAQKHGLEKDVLGQKINVALEVAGFQYSESRISSSGKTKKVWYLTEKGKEFGVVLMDQVSANKNVENVRWLPSVIDHITVDHPAKSKATTSKNKGEE